MPTLIPAVAYTRMSTDHQENSPAQQRTAIEKLAVGKYKILRWYQDEGISGDSERREGFRQLIQDATNGADFKFILCWDQDRFSRFDPIEANYYWHMLRKAGVQIATVAQGVIDFEDLGGWLSASVNQYGKHQFLRDLARNSLRGVIARANKGLWPGGAPAFGYVLGEDGKLAVGDPAKVKAVREVFRLRLKGYGYRSIARRMNDQGVSSPSGGPWSHDAVRLVLDRETYCGVVTLGGTPQGKHYVVNGGEITAVRRGSKQRSKPMRFEDMHPAIIDPKDWQAAQAVKAKPFAKGSGEGSPLAGLLYCGNCGGVMYAQSLQRSAGQRHPNYCCSTYHKGRGCGYCTVPQDAMLAAVADVIRDRVLRGSKDRLQEAVERVLARRAAQDSAAAKRERLKSQVTRLTQQIDRAAERLLRVDDGAVASVESKLAQLCRQRDEAQAELAATKASKNPKLDAKRIVSQIWQLDDVLRGSGPADVRAALSKVVERIDLHFEPGKKTLRGQAFEFAGAEMTLCTKAWGYGGVNPLLGTTTALTITQEQVDRYRPGIAQFTATVDGELALLREIVTRYSSRAEQLAEWRRRSGKSAWVFKQRLRALTVAA